MGTPNLPRKGLAHAVLGYSSYADYLQSDLWRTIRARVLQRDAHACRDCGVMDEPLMVHHLSYDLVVLEGHDDRQLLTVCEYCHRQRQRHHPFDGDYLPFQTVEVPRTTPRRDTAPRLITAEVRAEREATARAVRPPTTPVAR